jgi:hypothetical protein
MVTATDLLARGKVTRVMDGTIVFQPQNTNYEMYLQPTRPFSGPVGQLISARIRVKARKVYTVPSGGGFISPIFGPPRTIQGRALKLDGGSVIVRAGTPIEVTLPTEDDGMDLAEGPIDVGALVNAVAMPGATIELVSAPRY